MYRSRLITLALSRNLFTLFTVRKFAAIQGKNCRMYVAQNRKIPTCSAERSVIYDCSYLSISEQITDTCRLENQRSMCINTKQHSSRYFPPVASTSWNKIKSCIKITSDQYIDDNSTRNRKTLFRGNIFQCTHGLSSALYFQLTYGAYTLSARAQRLCA